MARPSISLFASGLIAVRLVAGSERRGDLFMVDDSDPRRAERVPLRADIEFRRVGEHRWRVNILDFSPEGCRVDLPVKVDVEDLVWISLPGIESIQGIVCWVKEWEAGVQFAKPLYPSVFDMVRERMSKAE
jgi:hypothetical protein